MTYADVIAPWPGIHDPDTWTAYNLLRYLDVHGLGMLVKPKPQPSRWRRGNPEYPTSDWRLFSFFLSGRDAYELRVTLNQLILIDPKVADAVACKIIAARNDNAYDYGVEMRGFVGGHGIDAERVIRERLDYLRKTP